MNELTAEYTKAVDLDRRIKVSAQLAQQNLYEVCKGLKEMRDGKLYKELGYKNFDEYAENEVGIKHCQAYKYILVAEKFSEDFVHSSVQIGMTKLSLLATLDEPQREEIQQTVDLESTTVRELKEKIDSLKAEKEQAEAEFKQKKQELFKKNLALVEEKNAQEEKLTELESQIKELENRPHEVFEDTSKIEELKRQLAEQQEELESVKNTSQNVSHSTPILDVFKAYMKSTVDAMRSLTAFAEQNKQNMTASERQLVCDKLEMIITLTRQSAEKMKGV